MCNKEECINCVLTDCPGYVEGLSKQEQAYRQRNKDDDVCYNCIEGKCLESNWETECDKNCSLCDKHKCNKSFPKCPKNEGKEV